MSGEPKSLRFDAWAVFRKVGLTVFLLIEVLAWRRLQWAQFRPGQRLLILLLDPRFTLRIFLIAVLWAGLVTLLGYLIVEFVVRPVLDRWLRPRTDPSVGSFHLEPAEKIVSSVPARKKSGRSWQAGSLVLTDRRLWFFPESWSMEPWSVLRRDVARLSTEPAWFARWLPIQNWPPRMIAEMRAGNRDAFALANPVSFAAWFDSHSEARLLPQNTFL